MPQEPSGGRPATSQAVEQLESAWPLPSLHGFDTGSPSYTLSGLCTGFLATSPIKGHGAFRTRGYIRLLIFLGKGIRLGSLITNRTKRTSSVALRGGVAACIRHRLGCRWYHQLAEPVRIPQGRERPRPSPHHRWIPTVPRGYLHHHEGVVPRRSEERRVGKECRWEGSV